MEEDSFLGNNLCLFRDALDQASDSVVITNAQLDPPGPLIMYVNPAFSKMTGYSSKEAIGNSPRVLQGPGTSKRTLQRLKSSLKKGEEVNGEVLNYRKDGKEFILQWHIAPIRNKKNDITHFVSIQADVTSQRKREREIRKQKEILDLIFNNIPIVLALYDKKNHLVEFNRTAHETIGWDRLTFDINKIFELGFPDVELRKEAREYFDNPSSPWKYFPIVTKFGNTLDISWSVVKLSDESGIIIGQDISHYIREEKERREFISAVAHELKTPITTLKLMLKAIVSRVKDLNPYLLKESEVKLADDEMNRLTRLVNDMLDISRFEIGKLRISFEPVNVSEIARDTVAKLKNVIGRYSIITKIDKDIFTVADSDRLSQVLINLVTNAAKHSEDNTKIIVSVIKKRGYCQISVKDFGIGIPKDKLPFVFDRFFQVKNIRTDGFGLGLFISKEIVERHHGKIWVESEVGKGSTFFVQLPLLNRSSRKAKKSG